MATTRVASGVSVISTGSTVTPSSKSVVATKLSRRTSRPARQPKPTLEDETEEKPGGNVWTDPHKAVLVYLGLQNRPYSVGDIVANMQTQKGGVKVTKPVAMKVLKDLTEAGEIECRTAGKASVWHAKQDTSCSSLQPSAIFELDSNIDSLRTNVSTLASTEKSLRIKLTSIQSASARAAATAAASDPDRLTDILNQKKEVETGLRTKIDKIEGEKRVVNGIGDDEDDETGHARLDGEMKRWNRTGRNRKAIVRNIWGLIEEGVRSNGGNVKELKELFCLDD